ncbi:MAG: DUF421 domain-containing protein [Chitinophagaceae bacterium]|nr:DUF421 domain-containing protein [Chitinophagaceae bacterium]
MDFNILFGSGEDLNPLQMAVRGFIMFFITLLLIRIGGMRIFGKKSAFDYIIIIMLGAVLARGVVGASPFLSTVVAAFVMILVHKLLAMLAMKYIWIGKIVKGIHRPLYNDGQMDIKNMKIVAISKDDLMEAVRLQLNKATLDTVKEIIIEKNGELSVIEKEN